MGGMSLRIVLVIVMVFINNRCDALLPLFFPQPTRNTRIAPKTQSVLYDVQIMPRQKEPTLFSHTSSSNSVLKRKYVAEAATSNDTACSTSNSDDDNIDRSELGQAFSQKMIELEGYQRVHENCLVPKRYAPNPSLGNWVNKQRQHYRRLMNGERSSMNEVSTYDVFVNCVSFMQT